MDTVIGATEFKAQCLRLLANVEQHKNEVIITKHGRPVARLIPVELDDEAVELFGAMKDSVIYTGDLVSPVDEAWEAAQ
jgi:prevent-host-death family protein